MTAVVIALLPAAGFGIYNFGPQSTGSHGCDHCQYSIDGVIIRLALEEKNHDFRYVSSGNGTAAALNLPVSITAVDGGIGRCVCHPCGKNAVRWSGSELYEPGTGSQMLSADLFPVQ